MFMLGAQVIDFTIITYKNYKTSEIALILYNEDKVFIKIAQEDSRNKAKKAVAEKMIHSANIWTWFNMRSI